MARVLQTPLSELDLLEIWVYIGEDSLSAADRWLDEIHARCEMLAEHPELGRRRDEIAPGLRSFPVDSYLIFYRPVREGIRVMRVLHGSRDIEEQFRT